MAKEKERKSPVRSNQSQKKDKLPLGTRIKNWFKGVQSELRKVTWPTRKELINYTLIVIVMTVILAAAMGLFDLFFQQLFFHWL